MERRADSSRSRRSPVQTTKPAAVCNNMLAAFWVAGIVAEEAASGPMPQALDGEIRACSPAGTARCGSCSTASRSTGSEPVLEQRLAKRHGWPILRRSALLQYRMNPSIRGRCYERLAVAIRVHHCGHAGLVDALARMLVDRVVVLGGQGPATSEVEPDGEEFRTGSELVRGGSPFRAWRQKLAE